MTLFDYRTDHLSFDPSWEERARTHPTFLYAMPLGPVPEEGVSGQRFFFEETSLVGRPAMSFQECKDRLFARLSHLGITVRPCSIKDEEFCNIPMGGPLPEPGQRVIAFGGAAALVHPSTGYHLCRMMAAAKELTDAVGEALANPADLSPDAVASLAYDAIWSPPKQVQRDFAVFGGEFLMSLGVEELRGWFDSFFRLPIPLWGGFLAGWPTLPGNQLHETWFSRFVFGLQIVTKLPVPVALELIKSITVYTMIHGNSLLRSVTPFFGQPQSYRLSA
jgi:lycopene beta-cyclase